MFVFLAVLMVAARRLRRRGRAVRHQAAVDSLSGTTLTPAETVLRTVLAIVLHRLCRCSASARSPLFASTRTDSSLAAALAALATFVTSQVLDLHRRQPAHPALPADALLAVVRRPLPRSPSLATTSSAASLLQGVYIVVFLGLAWASFATKDITS